MDQWAIVEHSAWAIDEDPQFEHGLEIRLVTSEEQAKGVTEAGGRVFEDRAQAEAYAEAEMYPEGATGLIPEAPGQFSSAYAVAGLRVYVPPVHGGDLAVGDRLLYGPGRAARVTSVDRLSDLVLVGLAGLRHPLAVGVAEPVRRA